MSNSISTLVFNNVRVFRTLTKKNLVFHYRFVMNYFLEKEITSIRHYRPGV